MSVKAGSVKVHEGTWLESRGISTTTYHQTSNIGLRTSVLEWVDEAHVKNGGWPAGTKTRKVVKGDGRYHSGPKAFQIIEPEVIMLPGTDEWVSVDAAHEALEHDEEEWRSVRYNF